MSCFVLPSVVLLLLGTPPGFTEAVPCNDPVSLMRYTFVYRITTYLDEALQNVEPSGNKAMDTLKNTTQNIVFTWPHQQGEEINRTSCFSSLFAICNNQDGAGHLLGGKLFEDEAVN